jgi:hypothetical protein
MCSFTMHTYAQFAHGALVAGTLLAWSLRIWPPQGQSEDYLLHLIKQQHNQTSFWSTPTVTLGSADTRS